MPKQSEFNDAIQFHQKGDLRKAEQIYRSLLKREPRNFDVNYLLGLLFLQSEKFDRAEKQLRKAISINQAIPAAFNDLGNALLASGKATEALESYRRAVAIDPKFADAFNNCGNALTTLGRLEEAIASYDQAITAKSDYAMAYYNRGNALRDLRRDEDAVASYQRAIAIEPHYPQALNNCGSALLRLGRPEEALSALDRTIVFDPFFVEAFCNRASALIDLRRFDEALAVSEKALTLDAASPKAWICKADGLRNLMRYDDAIVAYEKALALDSSQADAWLGLGVAFHAMKRPSDAARAYRSLLAIAPDYNFAKGHLLYECMSACDWHDFDMLTQALERDVRAGKKSAEPFGYQAVAQSAHHLMQCAQIYATAEFPKAPVPMWNGRRSDSAKIRVGYLSGEFRTQATSILMVGLFEKHDKDRFEQFLFDNGYDDGGEIRSRINSAADQIIKISQLGDFQAASEIHRNKIDILVNLNGFFGEGRTGVFAQRPAPIQVSYLGFPGTMGADYIDYIIADRFVIPPEDEAHYVEKVVRLPDSYQINDTRRRIDPRTLTRADVMLPDTGFVYCCFNNNYKITPQVFEVWMRLLNAVPGSALWLLEDNSAAAHNLRSQAVACGVAPERLVFAPRMGLSEHLARHRLADLFLDTLPYNAHTTASDALWAGLPVITCLGSTFPGRVAASLLYAIGLPELITRSLGDYEALAVKLARDEGLLLSVRDKLMQNRTRFPLFDTTRCTRHIEAAYLTMWERHRRGEAPAGFSVSPHGLST